MICSIWMCISWNKSNLHLHAWKLSWLKCRFPFLPTLSPMLWHSLGDLPTLPTAQVWTVTERRWFWAHGRNTSHGCRFLLYLRHRRISDMVRLRVTNLILASILQHKETLLQVQMKAVWLLAMATAPGVSELHTNDYSSLTLTPDWSRITLRAPPELFAKKHTMARGCEWRSHKYIYKLLSDDYPDQEELYSLGPLVAALSQLTTAIV